MQFMEIRLKMDSRMMNIYYNLFYRLYRFAKKVGTTDATWTSMLVLSALVFLNLMSLLLFVFGKDIFFISPSIFGGLTVILICVINYLIFIRHDNCFTIINQFDGESKLHKRRSIILTIIYILITLILSHISIK